MALTQISTQGIKDGTITGTDLATNVDLVDNQKLRLGTGNDLQIYHNGSNSFIDESTGTGKLIVRSSGFDIKTESSAETMATFVKDGAVELYYDNNKKFETTSLGATLTGRLTSDGLDVGDSESLRLGNNFDLQIFHDASNSHLVNTTGELRIASDDLRLMRANGTEHYFVGFVNSYTALYFDNSIKLQTASSGISVTGDITGTGHLDFGDDAKLKMGASDDLEIFHESGGNSFISNATGYLLVNSTSGDNVIRSSNNVFLQPASGETGVKAIANGAVELYHNNSKKFETTSNGATVSVASGDPQLIVTGPGHALLQLTSTSGTDHCGVNFGDNDDNNAGMIQYTNSTNIMQFHTNGSERMRIASNGNALFHTTTNDNTIAGAGGIQLSDDANGSFIRISKKNTHAVPAIEFHNPNGRVGQIIPSGTSTSYSTSGSDRSLKKNFESWNEDVLTLFKNINPQKFNFIQEEDGTEKTKGFIAQEITDSFPEAYIKGFGEDEKYMFNPSGMVVYLMKAIQDLNAKVEVLETEVAALKAA